MIKDDGVVAKGEAGGCHHVRSLLESRARNTVPGTMLARRPKGRETGGIQENEEVTASKVRFRGVRKRQLCRGLGLT